MLEIDLLCRRSWWSEIHGLDRPCIHWNYTVRSYNIICLRCTWLTYGCHPQIRINWDLKPYHKTTRYLLHDGEPEKEGSDGILGKQNLFGSLNYVGMHASFLARLAYWFSLISARNGLRCHLTPYFETKLLRIHRGLSIYTTLRCRLHYTLQCV